MDLDARIYGVCVLNKHQTAMFKFNGDFLYLLIVCVFTYFVIEFLLGLKVLGLVFTDWIVYRTKTLY